MGFLSHALKFFLHRCRGEEKRLQAPQEAALLLAWDGRYSQHFSTICISIANNVIL